MNKGLRGLLLGGAAIGTIAWSSSDPPSQMTSPIARVTEQFDESDGGRLTGRFTAHAETPDGMVEGPSGVPVAEALQWARRQADVVVVRVGQDQSYSAGREDAPGVAARWPEGGIEIGPRPVGVLPGEPDADVSWSAIVHVAQTGAAGREDAEDVRRALLESDAVDAVAVVEDGGGLRVECRVRANGVAPAMELLDGLVADRLSFDGVADGYPPVVEIGGRA